MMTSPATLRHRLPNRRPSETRTLHVHDHAFAANVGFDPADGRPREIFLAGAKDGTGMAAILDDASVVISVALQHGVAGGGVSKPLHPSLVAGGKPLDLAVEPVGYVQALAGQVAQNALICSHFQAPGSPQCLHAAQARPTGGVRARRSAIALIFSPSVYRSSSSLISSMRFTLTTLRST